MHLELLKHPDARLLAPARPVRHLGPPLERLAVAMGDLLASSGGQGLAAVQVGLPLRLAVLELDLGRLVLVNPRLVSRRGHQESRERCLSGGDVVVRERAAEVVVVARGLDGRRCLYTASGWEAALLQHELDHLAGRWPGEGEVDDEDPLLWDAAVRRPHALGAGRAPRGGGGRQ